MENEGYIRSNIRLIIFTILTTLFVLFSVIFILFYIDESNESNVDVDLGADEAQAEVNEEQEETTISIIDEEELLDTDTEDFIIDKVLPLANKHFEIEEIKVYFIEGDNRHMFDMTVSNESFGKLVSQRLQLNGSEDDINEFNEMIESNIFRLTELMALKVDKAGIQLTTPDMASRVLMRVYDQKLGHNFFRLQLY